MVFWGLALQGANSATLSGQPALTMTYCAQGAALSTSPARSHFILSHLSGSTVVMCWGHRAGKACSLARTLPGRGLAWAPCDPELHTVSSWVTGLL